MVLDFQQCPKTTPIQCKVSLVFCYKHLVMLLLCSCGIGYTPQPLSDVHPESLQLPMPSNEWSKHLSDTKSSERPSRAADAVPPARAPPAMVPARVVQPSPLRCRSPMSHCSYRLKLPMTRAQSFQNRRISPDRCPMMDKVSYSMQSYMLEAPAVAAVLKLQIRQHPVTRVVPLEFVPRESKTKAKFSKRAFDLGVG